MRLRLEREKKMLEYIFLNYHSSGEIHFRSTVSILFNKENKNDLRMFKKSMCPLQSKYIRSSMNFKKLLNSRAKTQDHMETKCEEGKAISRYPLASRR